MRSLDLLSTYEPHYSNSCQRSEVGKLIDRLYWFNHQALQEYIAAKSQNLDEALHELHGHQLEIGFILDDGSQIQRFKIVRPDGQHSFFVQYNPRRAARSAGAGRKEAPTGAITDKANDPDCFLCVDNQRWQQRGVQHHYMRFINGSSYNFCCNPFPFGPLHITVASDQHEPQHLDDTESNEVDRCRRVVSDLYDIASLAPSFYALYNGVKAGASIPRHLHFHLMQNPRVLFPLQAAARETEIADGCPSNGVLHINEPLYPLSAFRIKGERDFVISETVALAKQWREIAGSTATENLIVIAEDGITTMYYVPRDKQFPRAAELAGEVGGLEVLGELLLSTDNERKLLDEGRINYSFLRGVLQSVRPLQELNRELEHTW